MPSNNGFDTKLVKDLAKILRDSELTEIEIDNEGTKIRVTRNVTQTVVAAAPVAAAPVAAAPVATPAAAAAPDHRRGAARHHVRHAPARHALHLRAGQAARRPDALVFVPHVL